MHKELSFRRKSFHLIGCHFSGMLTKLYQEFHLAFQDCMDKNRHLIKIINMNAGDMTQNKDSKSLNFDEKWDC